MNKINGVLKTFENNSMSLSCYGEVKIKDSIVIDKSFKGYPRPGIDGWTSFYKKINIGDRVDINTINKIILYNGQDDIISKFQNKENEA